MEGNQIRRANGVLMIALAITTLFNIIGLLTLLQNAEYAGINPALPIATIAMFIACFVVWVVLFVTQREKYTLLYVAEGLFLFLYAFAMITQRSATSFPYIFPILAVFVIFGKRKVVNSAAIIQLVVNIIMVMMTAANAENMQAVAEQISIEAICSILGCIVFIMGNNLIIQFHEEARGAVEVVATHNEEMTEQVVETAKSVLEAVTSTKYYMDSIDDRVRQVNLAMENIEASTSATADAVMQQSDMTETIKNVISDTVNKTAVIAQLTDTATAAVAEGATSVEELNQKAERVIEGGHSMQEAANKLQEKSVEVRSITDIILNISSQTNLLALNASIEAARAGEAGKGFAVVADEIRILADQTRSATEDITSILDTLVVEAQAVSQKVGDSVATNQEQSELIHATSEGFQTIQSSIEELNGEIAVVNQMMADLQRSNAQIVESVETLSATSQEVTASAMDTKRLSAECVDTVAEFDEKMKGVEAQVRSLASFEK